MARHTSGSHGRLRTVGVVFGSDGTAYQSTASYSGMPSIVAVLTPTARSGKRQLPAPFFELPVIAPNGSLYQTTYDDTAEDYISAVPIPPERCRRSASSPVVRPTAC